MSNLERRIAKLEDKRRKTGLEAMTDEELVARIAEEEAALSVDPAEVCHAIH